jgi:hypothetical protein
MTIRGPTKAECRATSLISSSIEEQIICTRKYLTAALSSVSCFSKKIPPIAITSIRAQSWRPLTEQIPATRHNPMTGITNNKLNFLKILLI